MKPAGGREEYASIRFRLVWTSAARFPTASEQHAITAIVTVQSRASCGNAVTRTRIVSTSAAVFVAADMNAVPGVGALSYPWGVHMWTGPAEALKPSPPIISARPAT